MEIKTTDDYLIYERPLMEKAMKRLRRQVKRKKKNLCVFLERLKVCSGVDGMIREIEQDIQQTDRDLHYCEIILEQL